MQAGELLAGRYRIGALLGRGGMGSVWRARDETLGRDVAVKLLESIRGEESLRRFRREGQILGALRHPGLVEVYEFGVDAGQPFIAQELVEGEDLAALRKRVGRLEPPAVRRLARELADALAFLHGRGVLHRDIKPANVFRRSDGRFVLMDFGLARSDEQTVMTVTGELLGTPVYMPPQQLLGEPYDTAADVYQAGLVIHEAATGVHLHGEAPDLHAYMMAMASGTQVLSSASEGLPSDLRRLVARCCAREPSARPRDGAALVELVAGRASGGDASLRSGPVPAVTPSSGVVRGAGAARPPLRRGVVVVVALVLMGILAAGRRGAGDGAETAGAVEPLEWVQWTDGLDLVLPRPPAGSAAFRLMEGARELRRGGAVAEGGFVRIELRGLPARFRGTLVVEAGGVTLGTWAVALPVQDLATPATARFGPAWVEVTWGLHGRGGVTLEVEPEGGAVVRRRVRGQVERVDVTLVDELARAVAWRVRRGERLVASGQGRVGIGRRTSFVELSGLSELTVPATFPPSALGDEVLAVVPPCFLLSLHAAPSPSGTTLVPSWVMALSRRGLPDRELGWSLGVRHEHALALALPLEGGDALVVSRRGEGYVGRLRGRLRRAAFEGAGRPTWRTLMEAPPVDDGVSVDEPRIAVGAAVGKVRAAGLGPGLVAMVATLGRREGRRVEPWVADTRNDALVLRRGEALVGAGGLVCLTGVGGRFVVAVTLEEEEGTASVWSLDARPASGPRVAGRVPLAAGSPDLVADGDVESAVAAAVGPRRVLLAAGRGLHVVDLDDGGRPSVTRLAVELEESCRPQSVHVLGPGRIMVMFVRRYHSLANVPASFEAVLLEEGGAGPGGYSAAVRSPEVVAVVPATMMAGTAWLHRGGLLWALPGQMLLALGADGEVTPRFRAEILGENTTGPLVEAGGSLFAFTRDGGILGCDLDPAEGGAHEER